MAALTDQSSPQESLPATASQVEQSQDGAGEESLPEVTPEQLEQLLTRKEELRRWDQSRTDKRARAQADAWAEQTKQQALLEQLKADDERFGRISDLILDGQLPSDEDEKWFNEQRGSRRITGAKKEVIANLASMYDEAYKKIPGLPHHDRFDHGGVFLEAVYEAGRASRDLEIEAEIEKRSEAKATEKMNAYRSGLPMPDATRTSTGARAETPRSEEEARQWHVMGVTPAGRPFGNNEMRRYLAQQR